MSCPHHQRCTGSRSSCLWLCFPFAVAATPQGQPYLGITPLPKTSPLKLLMKNQWAYMLVVKASLLGVSRKNILNTTQSVDTPENRWCATLSGRCWAGSRIQQQEWVRRRCCSHTQIDSMAHLHTAHLGSQGKGRMPHFGQVIWSPLFSALQTETPPAHICGYWRASMCSAFQ